MLLVIHLVLQSTDLIKQSQEIQFVTVNDGMTPVYLSYILVMSLTPVLIIYVINVVNILICDYWLLLCAFVFLQPANVTFVTSGYIVTTVN